MASKTVCDLLFECSSSFLLKTLGGRMGIVTMGSNISGSKVQKLSGECKKSSASGLNTHACHACAVLFAADSSLHA